MATGNRKRTYAYGKNYRPCPWSQNKVVYYNGNADHYIAYCTSNKNPSVIGNHAVKVKDDYLAAKCIGRCLDGESYTACPYYSRMKKNEREVKKKSDVRSARRTAIFGDPMLIFAIIVVVLTIIGMSK